MGLKLKNTAGRTLVYLSANWEQRCFSRLFLKFLQCSGNFRIFSVSGSSVSFISVFIVGIEAIYPFKQLVHSLVCFLCPRFPNAWTTPRAAPAKFPAAFWKLVAGWPTAKSFFTPMLIPPESKLMPRFDFERESGIPVSPGWPCLLITQCISRQKKHTFSENILELDRKFSSFCRCWTGSLKWDIDSQIWYIKQNSAPKYWYQKIWPFCLDWLFAFVMYSK